MAKVSKVILVGEVGCSISFLCARGSIPIFYARLSPLGEVYGMSSTSKTGCLTCTSAVSRFNATRGSITIFYARSYRRLGKCTVCHRVQYLVLVPHGAVYRYVMHAVIEVYGMPSTPGIYACSYSRMGLCVRCAPGVRYVRAQVHRRRGLRPSSDQYLNDDQCPRKYVCAAPE